MLAFTPIILALLPVALSAPSPRTREPTITAFAGNHVCPSSLLPFHASTSLSLPGQSAERVWQELGDFCDVEWQGFEILSTKGACDTQRSLRTYRAADIELTERLDLILLPSKGHPSPLIPDVFARHLKPAPGAIYAHGYTMLNRPTIAGADVIRMKTLLKVVESTQGTKITWDVVGCSDYPEHLADKLEEVHEGALWAVEKRVAGGSQSGIASALGTSLQMMESVMDAAML